MMLGKIATGFEESMTASSGVFDEPVKLVQPAVGLQRKVLTRESVLTQFQAARIFPLWARIADGFLPKPEPSRTVGDPNWRLMMFEDESREMVTGTSLMFPAPAPPSTMIRREVRDTRTAAGLA